MSIRTKVAGVHNTQYADVHAIGVRDGKVFMDKCLSHHESFGHRARRLASKALPWLMIAFVAGSAINHHYNPHPLGLPEYLGAATVITNGGQAIVTNRMIAAGTEPKYVAWGTGAGTAAIADTTLFTESTEEARTNGTSSRVTTTVTNDTYQVVGMITVVTSNKTITNVGLFDAITTGNLYFKSDFTGLALLIGDSITFTIKVKFA